MKSEVVALYADRAAAVADEWVKLAEGRVRAAAAVSKRSDAELMRVCLGTAPVGHDIQNAALAMFRARTGQPIHGCGCDAEAAATTLDALETAA